MVAWCMGLNKYEFVGVMVVKVFRILAVITVTMEIHDY
jgi:hypothetical protein